MPVVVLDGAEHVVNIEEHVLIGRHAPDLQIPDNPILRNVDSVVEPFLFSALSHRAGRGQHWGKHAR